MYIYKKKLTVWISFVSKEYVQLYVEFILNQSIYKQFQAFYHGFHSVCASNALIVRNVYSDFEFRYCTNLIFIHTLQILCN